MADLTLTTELEAVNEMLRVIGEAPVNALDDSGLKAVADARRVLHNTSRQVQSTGWHFNSEKNYPLSRDGDGKIAAPPDALRIDSSGNYADIDLVKRGVWLYDRGKHTYVFQKDITVDVVWFLEFESLPQSARWFITVRAARIFQDGAVTSVELHKFTEADEIAARAQFLDDESEEADYNMFSGSNSVACILAR